MNACISSNFVLIICFDFQTNRRLKWEALYKGKFGYEYGDDSARGMPCLTNSKHSLFSTLFTFFRSASLSFLFKCSFFANYCELYFSFSRNILKDSSAAQFSREQKHTVETFFFLHGCILYHYSPTLSNNVNTKNYSSQ